MRWTREHIEALKAKGLTVSEVPKNKCRYVAGIDPGTKTGFSVWDRHDKKLIVVDCMKMHVVMEQIRVFAAGAVGGVFVRVEDARQAVFGRNGAINKSKLQGAGSIKRDCTIWFDYLTSLNIPFEMVRPNKRLSKWDAITFRQTTGWTGRTNSHSRDSALLVFGL